eukprot:10938102-Alexandrium_andersonii.AAC.1
MAGPSTTRAWRGERVAVLVVGAVGHCTGGGGRDWPHDRRSRCGAARRRQGDGHSTPGRRCPSDLQALERRFQGRVNEEVE